MGPIPVRLKEQVTGGIIEPQPASAPSELPEDSSSEVTHDQPSASVSPQDTRSPDQRGQSWAGPRLGVSALMAWLVFWVVLWIQDPWRAALDSGAWRFVQRVPSLGGLLLLQALVVPCLFPPCAGPPSGRFGRWPVGSSQGGAGGKN